MVLNKTVKKISAGFMAGLCAFSMLASTAASAVPVEAAALSTENSAFPSVAPLRMAHHHLRRPIHLFLPDHRRTGPAPVRGVGTILTA